VTYDSLKRYFLPKGEEGYEGFEKASRRFASGFLSGLLSLTLTYPFDVARSRMAMDFARKGEKLTYKGVFNCLRQSQKNSGISSIWSGYIISVLGSAPQLAISLTAYDMVKEVYLQPGTDENLINVFNYAGIGTLAGLFAQIFTYPFDTVRRRLQVNGAVGIEKFYTGTIDCIGKMFKKEGFGAFYLGFVPNLIKFAPAAAIQFAAYDFLKSQVLDLKQL